MNILINMIKDLFTSPKNVNSKCLIQVVNSILPPKGFLYLMWCGKIYIRNKNVSKFKGYSKSTQDTVLNHERIHVDQAKLVGSWIGYYLAYLWYWLVGLFTFKKKAAYYTNRFEVEAYANEKNLDYVVTMDNKYNLKNKRKLWIKHFKGWKTWLKTL